jgi:hypothetical protein
MMRSAGEISYNALVAEMCDKALLEEGIIRWQMAEEGGEGEQSLAILQATRSREG